MFRTKRKSCVLAESASGVRLAPALDQDQVDRFESGVATVYYKRGGGYRWRAEDDPDGDFLFLPAWGKVCSIKMTKDEEGSKSS